jgi:hypothetical protein
LEALRTLRLALTSRFLAAAILALMAAFLASGALASFCFKTTSFFATAILLFRAAFLTGSLALERAALATLMAALTF